ncbi:MAG TPA: NAD-dependent deacylase [Bacteroidales bacterium]|jgi:NAD-dependent deacetylase|nr:NAD-dependent deacylase [Bacteroidales bacterium]HOH83559.1 NAD-dependent deacylase [Bacteroidales bacterium]HPB24364.1 NAD-dependent deacylase [Bacteroidales bacterium]HPI29031.1 NAD-dependent deacylase [Bacteroidales bacterium]HQN15293.1 NAD-dependent deacylase [Bacteroidales bacterium]
MKTIVVLTGAGISAESGIKTFRDSDGLWEEHRIEDVATFDAWKKNRSLVLDFYNQRRRQLATVQPNAAHRALARLEEKFHVQIITQNVDNLHERAGSSNILHLHGELTKARSSLDESLIYDIGYNDIREGDKCSKGSQLRPHIVWFGEAVPNIMTAATLAKHADILLVIGTSLVVYPAAGLLNYTPSLIPKYYVDPNAANTGHFNNLTVIKEKAGTGVPALVKQLLS